MNDDYKRFFELYYINLSKFPEIRQIELYEMTELHYIKEYGERRYKDYGVFRVRFHYFLKKIRNAKKR